MSGPEDGCLGPEPVKAAVMRGDSAEGLGLMTGGGGGPGYPCTGGRGYPVG